MDVPDGGRVCVPSSNEGPLQSGDGERVGRDILPSLSHDWSGVLGSEMVEGLSDIERRPDEFLERR